MLIFPTLITKRTHFNPFLNSGKQQEAAFGKNAPKCTQEVTKRSSLKPNTFLVQPEQDTGGRSLVLLCDA